MMKPRVRETREVLFVSQIILICCEGLPSRLARRFTIRVFVSLSFSPDLSLTPRLFPSVCDTQIVCDVQICYQFENASQLIDLSAVKMQKRAKVLSTRTTGFTCYVTYRAEKYRSYTREPANFSNNEKHRETRLSARAYDSFSRAHKIAISGRDRRARN